MKFNSKTTLAEHIKELENSGYLVKSRIIIPISKTKVRASTVYAVNFDNVEQKICPIHNRILDDNGGCKDC